MLSVAGADGDDPEGLVSWKKENAAKPKSEKEQEKSEFQQKMRALFDKRGNGACVHVVCDEC